jgi:hypothetical protein
MSRKLPTIIEQYGNVSTSLMQCNKKWFNIVHIIKYSHKQSLQHFDEQ